MFIVNLAYDLIGQAFEKVCLHYVCLEVSQWWNQMVRSTAVHWNIPLDRWANWLILALAKTSVVLLTGNSVSIRVTELLDFCPQGSICKDFKSERQAWVDGSVLKMLACKHKDRSWSPASCKRLGMVVCACNANAVNACRKILVLPV